MPLDKAEVVQQIENLIQQEKQAWANLNFLLGQKSMLEIILKELPDEPEPTEIKEESNLVVLAKDNGE